MRPKRKQFSSASFPFANLWSPVPPPPALDIAGAMGDSPVKSIKYNYDPLITDGPVFSNENVKQVVSKVNIIPPLVTAEVISSNVFVTLC